MILMLHERVAAADTPLALFPNKNASSLHESLASKYTVKVQA